MNYQQNDDGIRLNMSCADCLPALFSGFVYSVQAHKAVFVVEDQRRRFE